MAGISKKSNSQKVMVSVRPGEGSLFETDVHTLPASNGMAIAADSTQVESGASERDVDAATHLKTVDEQKAAFILLRSAGFDLGALDFNAAEALRWAVTGRYRNVITLLLDAGVDVNITTKDGLTALHWASKGGNVSVVERLLRSGANPDAKDIGFGRTPLHIASMLGRLDVAKLLLRHSARLSIRNTEGHTALHEAIVYNQDAMVDELVTHGADIEETDEDGRTAILLATSKHVYLIAVGLIRKGANVNAKDSAGTTCLHLAARWNVSFYVVKLLEAGADIEAKNMDGQTPLVYAAMYGSDTGVRRLIDGGADLDSKTPIGQAALSLARKGHHAKVVRLLIANYLNTSEEMPKDGEQLPDEIIGHTQVQATIPKQPATSVPAQRSMPWDSAEEPVDDPNHRIDADDWLGQLKNAASEAEIPPEMIGVDAGFGTRASIVQFAPGEKVPRATLRPTVHELLYGPGPRALMARLDTSDNPEFGSKFRWIHLPANNMLWVQDLVRKIYRERRSHREAGDKNDIRRDLLLRPEFWMGQQHLAHKDKVHARFMRPFFSKIEVDPSFSSLTRSENNFVLYMPYLSWEHSSAHNLTTKIVSDVLQGARDPSANSRLYGLKSIPKIAAAQIDHNEKLLRAYLIGDLPVHIRRTLDQSYYYTLQNTDARDKDQVVYRYTEKHLALKDPSLLMVDQLWLWIINGDTLVTSFPQRWGLAQEQGPHEDESDVFEGILRALNSGITLPERMMSAYDMALLVSGHCSDLFFTRNTKTSERLQFLEFFANSIGSVTEQQTACFESFWINFAQIEGFENGGTAFEDWSLPYKNGSTAQEGIELRRGEPTQAFDAAIQRLYDIRKETALLREIKDILDELAMMTRVFKQQLDVLIPLERTFTEFTLDLDGFSDPKEREFYRSQRLSVIKRSKNVVLSMNMHLNDLKELEGDALNTYKSLCDLLDLKQKQANVQEARSARKIAQQSAKQAEEATKLTQEAAKQGRAIMLFTVVTIIILPLSFFTSLFGMNAVEINGGTNGSSIPLATVFAYMIPISFVIISFALVLAFHTRSRTFYILQIRFIYHYFTKWTGLRWIARRVTPRMKEMEDYQAEKLKHV